MWVYKGFRWRITAAIAFLLFRLFLINADLPIHSDINDVKGTWKIFLSAAFETPQLCGSNLPNKNPDNLNPELDVRKILTNLVIFTCHCNGYACSFRITFSGLKAMLEECSIQLQLCLQITVHS